MFIIRPTPMFIGRWSLGPVIILTTLAPSVPAPITDVAKLLAFPVGIEKRGTITEVLVPRHSFVHLTVFHCLLSASLAPGDDGHTEF